MNFKNGLKLKGFTLIEMLVVITIIVILAGISSMVVSGFQRDARIETNNNKAQMAYSGFQNILIQCEIKQDSTIFDADAIPTTSGASYTPTYAGEKLTYSNVVFYIHGGQTTSIDITSYYENKVAHSVMRTLSPSSGVDENKKAYEEFKNSILSNVDNSFEGVIYANVDNENYTVDSVCYFERSEDYSLENFKTLGVFGFETDSKAKGKTFTTLKSLSDHKKIYDDKGVCYGVYPYMNNYEDTAYVTYPV